MEKLLKQLQDEEIFIADIDQETLDEFGLKIHFIDEGDLIISWIEDEKGKTIHNEEYLKDD